MNWIDDIAYFFGGAFLTNALPHFIAGTMGRAFQSPFAKPPGEGLSSSSINVVWGALYFAIAYGLLVWIGAFDLRAWDNIGAFSLGGLLIGLILASRFGRFNGGNSPAKE